MAAEETTDPDETPGGPSGPVGPRSGRYAYGRFFDGPDPLAPPFDLRAAMDQIGRDVMEGTSPRQAMRELMRRGLDGQRGLDDLQRRLNEQRRRLQRNHRLDGTLQEVRELLERALEAERNSLQAEDSDDARFREMQLDALPDSPAGAVAELAHYDWRNAEARQAYEELQELLGREALDQRFQGMKQAMENATPSDVEGVREMLSDLNDLLEAHGRGEDTTEAFSEFMAKHGQYFPENPQTTDELIDLLAERSAAAQRMMNSLSAEQRAELEGLMQSAFGDPRLAEQLSRLDAQLQSMRPGEDWDGQGRFRGENPMGMGEATRAMEQLAQMDGVGEQLSQAYPGARMEDIDLEALEASLGPQARVDAQRLAELERELERQGVFQRGADGTLTLSPKALRQLGPVGTARRRRLDLDAARGAGDPARPARRARRAARHARGTFGDTERWDVSRTLLNAEMRHAAGRRSIAGSTPGRGARPRRAGRACPRRRRRRDRRDRAAHPGRGGALRGHVLVDGRRRALGADEAHRARPAPPGLHPVPRRRAAADHVRAPRPDGRAGGADGPGGRLGAGHEPAPRAAARGPAPAPALGCRAGRPRGHRR